MKKGKTSFKRFLATQAIEISEHAWYAGRSMAWALIDFSMKHAVRYRDAFEKHEEHLHAHCDQLCGADCCNARVEHGRLAGCPLMDSDHAVLHRLLGDEKTEVTA